MRHYKYKKLERTIAASDGRAIYERWRYGRQLLCDETVITTAGNLRHGVLDRLIAAAKSAGFTLSEREIQYRLKCARAYQTEAEIRRASADFRYWWDLIKAGFPPVEKPEEGTAEAEPYDPRWTDERIRDNDRALRTAREERLQLLLPGFHRMMTLEESEKRNNERRDLATRMAAEADEFQVEFDDALDAVDGDRAATWDEALSILEGDPDDPDSSDTPDD